MELRRMGSPVSVLTKSDLVLRDADILAGWGGAEVGVSIGTVDDEMASLLEPGAPPPSRRFKAIRELSNNGIQAYVMAAPIIAGVGDSEDSLKRLVRMTADSDVKRIMWDKFNSKPIAGSRLRAALGRQSIELGRADDSWIRLVRGTLRRECGESGIELLEAF
jgi:DNA repair photolyase